MSKPIHLNNNPVKGAYFVTFCEIQKVIQREEKRLKEIEAGMVIRPGIDETLADKGIK